MQAEVKDQFLRFIASKTDEAVFSPKEGYFPFSVIADAFEKGTEHGEENFKQRIRDIYVKKIEIAIEAVTTLVGELDSNGYKASKLYLNHSISESLILISVDDALNSNKEFIQFAYKKASEIQAKLIKDSDSTISINFIDKSVVNEDLLSHDGYAFKFNFNTRTAE